jgi:hypothetical protein
LLILINLSSYSNILANSIIFVVLTFSIALMSFIIMAYTVANIITNSSFITYSIAYTTDHVIMSRVEYVIAMEFDLMISMHFK